MVCMALICFLSIKCYFHMCSGVYSTRFFFTLMFGFIGIEVPKAFCWSVLMVAMATLTDVEE